MRPKRTIVLEGFEPLIRKLGDPRLAREPMVEMLNDATKLGERAAMNAISGGTGIAIRSINRRVWANTLSARTYSMIARPRAMSIDKGRPPGEGTSIKAVARWVTGRTRLNEEDLARLSDEERSKIIQAWQAIFEHGAKGKHYITATGAVLRERLPELQKKAMRRLEELARR